jgi:hypothetical protein
MPMILRFGLLKESLSSCICLSQLLSCLTKISSVFSLISTLAWVLRFCPPLLVCWSGLPLCFFCLFVWLKRLIISQISIWFIFLRFAYLCSTSFLYFVLSFLIHLSPIL